ncbi:hypothetical protein [Micromonospora sp. NPDC005174]|uniref:hypothetical protein n=1 Tax=Micromonospora sp. NPDC005174 TaxID=3157018 RepID=UPI0033B46179
METRMSTNAATGVTVAITERRVPAPPGVQQDRAEAVDRLAGLGMIDPPAGGPSADMLVGFDVTVAGVPVEAHVLAYEVTSGETGPQVTVTFAADTVTVGAAQPASPAAATRNGRRQVWQPAPVDPRHGLPGWEPEGTPEVRDA